MKIREKKVLKLVCGALCAIALALPGAAEEWYLSANHAASTDNGSSFTTSVSMWTNAAGTAAQAIAAEDICHVENGHGLGIYGGNQVFPGAVLHLGAVDGSTAGVIEFRQHNLTVSDFRWHRGTFTVTYGNRNAYLAGDIHLDHPERVHKIFPAAGNVSWRFQAGFHCDDPEMEVVFEGNRNDLRGVFSGDNAAYKGSFSHTESGHTDVVFIQAHANALGDPATVRADAFSADGTKAVFSVLKGVVPNEARGLKINASGFRIRAKVYAKTFSNGLAFDCSEFELPMPVSGSYGFTKDGDGTVTMSGVYTAGDITVETGILHIAATAAFPPGQKIAVAAGASLVVHQSLARFDITAEEGASVERVLDPLTAAYDPAAGTVTPVVRGASFKIPDGMKQPLSLSSLIPVPFHEALEFEVLTVAAGADDFTGDDFTDTTEKTYGLPKTSFRVEKDADGVQHVYLLARPVVTSQGDFANVGINGAAANWSNEAMPSDGFDYLIQHLVGDVQDTPFAGGSLTVAPPGGELRFRERRHLLQTAAGGPVVIYPGVSTTEGYNGRNQVVSGAIELPGAYGDERGFNFHLKYGETATYDGRLMLAATLGGAGTLFVSGYKNNTSWNGISGDFTNWFGRLILTGSGTTDEFKGTQVRVSTPLSFGGRMDAFTDDAVTVTDYAMIKATADVALTNDMNRGILIDGHGGFNVDAEMTFRYTWPLTVAGTLYKHGEGTLEMGGATAFGDAASAPFMVRAGAVAPLSDAAVAGLDVVFSNGTEIVVSPGALGAGFTGALEVLPDPATGQAGRVRVTVSPAFDTGSSAAFEAVLCTVAESAGDVSALFDIVAPDGFEASLVQTAVTVGETAAVRCSVRYRRRGLSVIVR